MAIRTTAKGILGGLGLVFALGAQPAFAVEKYAIDNVHSAVIFKINHLGVGNSYGRFNDMTGEVTLDREAPEKSSVQITIKSESVDTNSGDRDKHLRGPDFFNTKQHPTITFKSSSVKKVSDTEFEVAGNLTLNGVSKPLTLKVTKTGEGTDPKGNFRAGFETTVTLKRSDYNMSYMLDKLGDDVTLTISAEGIRS